MTNPAVTQDTYRFYDDDAANPESCTPIGTLDTQDATVDLDTNFMVRIGAHITNSRGLTNMTDQLQYRVGTGGTWTNVSASSSNIRISAGTPTDGDGSGASLILTDPGGTAEEGYYDEGDGVTTSRNTDKDSAWEDQWCVTARSADLSGGEAIYFRMVLSADQVIEMTYPATDAATPMITINAAGATRSPQTGALTLTGGTVASSVQEPNPIRSPNTASLVITGGTIASSVTTPDPGSTGDILFEHVGAGSTTTISSTSWTLINGMTITPGAGTYLAIGCVTVDVQDPGSGLSAQISLYSNGSIEAGTIRQVEGEGSYNADTFRMMVTHKIITVGASQAIEIRGALESGASTTTVYDRSLHLVKIDGTEGTHWAQVTAASEASATLTATRTALTSMSLTTGTDMDPGTYLAIFSSYSRASGITSGNEPDIEVTPYVGGTEENTAFRRTTTHEASFNDTKLPNYGFWIITCTGTEVVEIYWSDQTAASGVTSYMGERCLTLVQLQSGDYEMFNSTTADQDNSTSYEIVDGMTTASAPAAGEYLALYSDQYGYNILNEDLFTWGIDVGGTVAADSEHTSSFAASLKVQTNYVPCGTVAEVNPNGSQQVAVHWKCATTTSRWAYNRTFILMSKPTHTTGAEASPNTGALNLVGGTVRSMVTAVAAAGAIALSGGTAKADISAAPKTGTLSLATGTVASEVSVAPAPGALSLSGGQVRLEVASKPQSGSLSLQGGTVSSFQTVVTEVPAYTGTLLLSGGSVITNVTSRPQPGALTLVPGSLRLEVEAKPQAASLLLTGGTVRWGQEARPQTASLTLSAGLVRGSIEARPKAASLLLTGGTAASSTTVTITRAAQTASLLLTGGTVRADVEARPQTASLTLTGGTVSSSVAEPLTAKPQTAQLVFTGGTVKAQRFWGYTGTDSPSQDPTNNQFPVYNTTPVDFARAGGGVFNPQEPNSRYKVETIYFGFGTVTDTGSSLHTIRIALYRRSALTMDDADLIYDFGVVTVPDDNDSKGHHFDVSAANVILDDFGTERLFVAIKGNNTSYVLGVRHRSTTGVQQGDIEDRFYNDTTGDENPDETVAWSDPAPTSWFGSGLTEPTAVGITYSLVPEAKPQTGSLVLTGGTVVGQATTVITRAAQTAALTLTGGTVRTDVVAAPKAAVLTISGGTVRTDATARPQAASLLLTGGTVTWNFTYTREPQTASLAFTGGTVRASVEARPQAGVLTLTGGTVVGTGTNDSFAYPQAGALALTGGTVKWGITSKPQAGALVITGGTVAITYTSDAYAYPQTGTLVLTGGTVASEGWFVEKSPQTGALVLTGGTIKTGIWKQVLEIYVGPQPQ